MNVDDPYFVESVDTVSTRGPRNITRNMLQDKTGKFWFATWEGIINYDGKIFTNFTLKENLKHFMPLMLAGYFSENQLFGKGIEEESIQNEEPINA